VVASIFMMAYFYKKSEREEQFMALTVRMQEFERKQSI
jgi:hypothetical protein